MPSDVSIIHSPSTLYPKGLNHSHAPTANQTQDSETLTAKPEEIGQTTLSTDTHQFLRLTLFPEVPVLLPMEQISEVLAIPIGQVVPIPSMPAWVMGIYNLRGDILWVANLSHFLDLLPWKEQRFFISNYTLVVLSISSKHLESESQTPKKSSKVGLIVNQTEDIEWCSRQDIQVISKTEMSSKLSQFSQGYWLNKNGETLAILDGESISEEMSHP